jgi:hypothetical protein
LPQYFLKKSYCCTGTARHEDIGENGGITQYILNFDVSGQLQTPLSPSKEPILNRRLYGSQKKKISDLTGITKYKVTQ